MENTTSKTKQESVKAIKQEVFSSILSEQGEIQQMFIKNYLELIFITPAIDYDEVTQHILRSTTFNTAPTEIFITNYLYLYAIIQFIEDSPRQDLKTYLKVLKERLSKEEDLTVWHFHGSIKTSFAFDISEEEITNYFGIPILNTGLFGHISECTSVETEYKTFYFNVHNVCINPLKHIDIHHNCHFLHAGTFYDGDHWHYSLHTIGRTGWSNELYNTKNEAEKASNKELKDSLKEPSTLASDQEMNKLLRIVETKLVDQQQYSLF